MINLKKPQKSDRKAWYIWKSTKKVEILSRGGWLAASWQVDWLVGWPANWLPGWLASPKQSNLFPKSLKSRKSQKKSTFSFENTRTMSFFMIFQMYHAFSLFVWCDPKKVMKKHDTFGNSQKKWLKSMIHSEIIKKSDANAPYTRKFHLRPCTPITLSSCDL